MTAAAAIGEGRCEDGRDSAFGRLLLRRRLMLLLELRDGGRAGLLGLRRFGLLLALRLVRTELRVERPAESVDVDRLLLRLRLRVAGVDELLRPGLHAAHRVADAH